MKILAKESEYLGVFGVIYKIENIVNKKLYIGQSINFLERYRSHCETPYNKNSDQYDLPLYRSIRKYGLVNFTITIIDTADSIDDLNKKEIYYISKLYTCIDYGKGYNLDLGGKNGLKSEYTKRKMSRSQSGKNNPSFGKLGDDSFRAIEVIDLDTGTVYGSMISCAEELYKSRKSMKQISRVTKLDNNRLSYKGKHFARIIDGSIYLKKSVADILSIEYDQDKANGKSYIILDKNKLSKKA